MSVAQKRYRAFISYSQADKAWATRLHAWLENYRVPLDAVAEVRLPRRLGRFFRDEEEMAAAADIAELVRRAIENAESLIVLCSPRSAQSRWVDAEIRHFRRTGRAGKVFAVIIDGVPNSSDPDTECFPPALRASDPGDGPDAMPIEPFGIDARAEGRARTSARLAAGLLDVDFDALWRRDQRRRARSTSIAVAGGAAIMGAFAVTALNGLRAERDAAAGRLLALHYFAERAQNASAAGKYREAARYGLAGLQVSTPDDAPAFAAQIENALFEAGVKTPWPPLTELPPTPLTPEEARAEIEEIARFACNEFLGGERWFTKDEIEFDGLLSEYWPDPDRDLCDGVPGAKPAPR